MKYIDLRSDTVTELTPEMRESILNYGQHTFDQDKSIFNLEKMAAKLMGK